MKICTKCKFEKDEGEYYTNGKYLRSECKKCTIKDKVNYIKLHPEKNKLKCKKYQIKHREELNLYWRNYRKKNPGKIKKWKAKCFKKYRKKNYEYNKKLTENLHPYYLKQHAIRARGFTKDQLEQYPEVILTIKEIIKNKRLCKSLTSDNLEKA